MKKNLKKLALMILSSALVFGFVSCSNDGSDNSNESGNNSNSGINNNNATIAATYVKNNNSNWEKIFLYSNNTAARAKSIAASIYPDGIIKKGSFTKSGNYENGTISIVWNKKAGSQTEVSFVNDNGSSLITVSNGTATIQSGNDPEEIFTLQQ
ncbi:MAG: hypothetical protein K6B17_08680 [Treponema sp.]|nr:hypothetical protein [Treponema sp.]